ncbi:SpoIIE family protein phosphatase [Streptomyces sp. SID486]|uniref:ATP-binding SpoIIE family protein phosphatase n=1 Tax=unclassified Streptomyces TaxID=2593676 RepID=UPI0013717807|nr:MULTISPECIES: SpoIIE family protein phosphatase [unclassified Streptomyces]MYW49640.1 SpoIIE family protein phosphatase [Streptomyces sp. SID161]MYX96810.1 SpoIIE family protein phosphatase [Streptomyces sp. SID486]
MAFPYIRTMGTEVDAFLGQLARHLRPQVLKLAVLLLQRLNGELPELWENADIEALTLEETVQHITALLDLLETRPGASASQAPPAALDLGRFYARRGIPVSRLLRAYRLGHLGLLEQMQAEAARLTGDWHMVHLISKRLVALGFDYVDRSSEEVVAAYEEERERLLQRRFALTDRASKLIGTTLDITRTAEELTEVCTEDFADLVTVDLLDSALDETGTGSPEALTQRRVAQRSVLDGCPESPLRVGETHAYPDDSEAVRALATGRSVLKHIAATETPPWLAPSDSHGRVLRDLGLHSVLLVPLHARGDTLGLVQFVRHRASVPFDDDDLLLAREVVSRAAVSIDNARRYTQERSTALTLQRTLLPRTTVEQPAVETASRYLPAGSGAGVGGDWYDVIPLSGARVALVVGDVVGHGLHAAATMGRLRTAVRAFADIDLMPDELLTHLDDVVIRMQREESPDEGETSATCLYAVYDPVSRRCSLASAGHIPPTVVTSPASGETARVAGLPEVPVGPPLGLGGLPFETGEFELPEDSLLVLHTDGLIAGRTRDVDLGLATLHSVLTSAPDSLEEICDRLLAALLPGRPADDIALLVARTHALDPDHVATMDLPSDPAAVSGARRFASDVLAAWGLEDLSFTTELVVSELVTNAIRYGRAPVLLRLILQSTLTCEVSDASSTAPHLRRARIYDEGGRGLLLVAQCAERWGTRHGREGKVIWAEQALPGGQRVDHPGG